MNQFINGLAMGKYSVYVWSSYGLAILILGIHILDIKRLRRETYQKLKQLQRDSLVKFQ